MAPGAPGSPRTKVSTLAGRGRFVPSSTTSASHTCCSSRISGSACQNVREFAPVFTKSRGNSMVTVPARRQYGTLTSTCAPVGPREMSCSAAPIEQPSWPVEPPPHTQHACFAVRSKFSRPSTAQPSVAAPPCS